MTDQRNLILAIVISVGIILGFQVFYEMPRMERQQLTESQDTGQAGEGVVPPSPAASDAASGGAPSSSAGVGAALDPNAALATSRADALARLPRVQIANGRVHGSIALDGVRFDDVTLVD